MPPLALTLAATNPLGLGSLLLAGGAAVALGIVFAWSVWDLLRPDDEPL